MRALNMAQHASKCMWPEDVKIDVLSHYLEGKALSHFNAQYENWWKQDQSLIYAMDCMHRAFAVNLTLKQAVALFEQPKDASRTFH